MLPIVMLPGLDGSGLLSTCFVEAMQGQGVTVQVLPLPMQGPQDYVTLASILRPQLPIAPFVLLAESFAGPLAIELAAASPPGLRGLILSTTFARRPVPLPAASARLPRMATAAAGVAGPASAGALADTHEPSRAATCDRCGAGRDAAAARCGDTADRCPRAVAEAHAADAMPACTTGPPVVAAQRGRAAALVARRPARIAGRAPSAAAGPCSRSRSRSCCMDEDAPLLTDASAARTRTLLSRRLAHGLLRGPRLGCLLRGGAPLAAVPALLAAAFFAVFFVAFFVAVLRAGAFFATAFFAAAFFAGAFFAAVALVAAFFVADFLAGAFLATFLLVAFFAPLHCRRACRRRPACSRWPRQCARRCLHSRRDHVRFPRCARPGASAFRCMRICHHGA